MGQAMWWVLGCPMMKQGNTPALRSSQAHVRHVGTGAGHPGQNTRQSQRYDLEVTAQRELVKGTEKEKLGAEWPGRSGQPQLCGVSQRV